jgi:hypothetical protein
MRNQVFICFGTKTPTTQTLQHRTINIHSNPLFDIKKGSKKAHHPTGELKNK